MIGLVLSLVLFAAQGIPVTSNQSGTITGTLRTATGLPAAGVRVSALASPESTRELATSTALASLGETDAAGRYRLEDIPPGRYYIVAGNIDVPTFYPGTVNANEGVVIRITPGLLLPGVDFVLNSVSVGRATALTGAPARPAWIIPIRTRVEGGGKVPIFAAGRFPTLRFTHMNGARIEAAPTAPNVTVSDTEYRVTMESLPEDYVLKSLTFGSTNLRNSSLQLASVTSVVANVASVIPVPESIFIVLERRPLPTLKGVRLSGQIRGDPNRSIYISGVPGVVYSDGTFEFFGVSRGRHAIVTLDNPGRERPLGVSVVVGDRDMSDVELEETSISPFAAGLPSAQTDPVNLVPTPRVPLAGIRGRVVDGLTSVPFDAGRVIVNNDHSLTFPLEADGRFEIRKLLPGRYVLEVVAYGVGTVSRSVELDDKDAELDLSITSAR